MLHWHSLPLFNNWRVIRPFHCGCDIPTAGKKNCGVFGENDARKVKILDNTCYEGTCSRQTATCQPLIVKIGSLVWAERVDMKEQIKRGTRPVYFIIPWRRHRWYDPRQTWRSEPRDFITFAKFQIKQLTIVTLESDISHYRTTMTNATTTAKPCQAAWDACCSYIHTNTHTHTNEQQTVNFTLTTSTPNWWSYHRFVLYEDQLHCF